MAPLADSVRSVMDLERSTPPQTAEQGSSTRLMTASGDGGDGGLRGLQFDVPPPSFIAALAGKLRKPTS